MTTNIFSYLKIALTSLALILLQGCETISDYSPRQKTTYSIGSTDVFVTLPQEKIVLEHSTDEGKNFPLPNPPLELFLPIVAIALFINALSENKVLNETLPLRDSLIEFDVTPLFLESLKMKLSAIKWLNVKNFTHNLDTEKKSIENIYKNSMAETVLLIEIKYAIKKDFSILKAYADISLFPKSELLKKYSEKAYSRKVGPYARFKRNNIFRDTLVKKETLAGTMRRKRKLNQAHLKNNGEIVKESLITLAESMTDEIVSSIQKNGKTLLD